jgi:hypothetical protein
MTGESGHQLGLKLFAQRQYEAASALFRLAITDEESCERWNDWASAELACGRQVRAEWGYRRALRLDPAHRDAAVNLAALLIAQRRLQESVPFLTPHAQSLTESEEATLTNLISKSGGPGAPTTPPPLPDPQLVLDAFLSMISLIPNDDPTMPSDLRAFNRQRKFDSRYYVEQCCELLKALPPEVQPLALAQLQQYSKLDYRFLLVLTCHYLAADDPQASLPFVRLATEVKPYDNHVQRLLMQAELAAMSEDLRARHPWAGLDEYLKGHFCDRPWRHLELQWDGALHVCCAGWLASPIGHVSSGSSMEVWNSPAAQAIRESILDGSFKYCGRLYCAWISCRALPPRSEATAGLSSPTAAVPADCYIRMGSDLIAEAPTAALPRVLERGPRDLVLSHDTTCNLACPKCRCNSYSANPEQQQVLARWADGFLEGTLEGANTLRLSGSGDLFASRHCRQLLQQRLTRDKYPKLRLSIMTNGQLFDRRAFEELDLHGRICDINISVDAAREETYRALLRGGDFNRLLTNLEFIDSLRVQEGEHFGLGLVFVVSSVNFREMPEFVRLGKRFHADIVNFTFLRNQMGWPAAEEFHKLNIANPNHPEHGEFLEVLTDKELSDTCVAWGALGYLHPM